MYIILKLIAALFIGLIKSVILFVWLLTLPLFIIYDFGAADNSGFEFHFDVMDYIIAYKVI